MRSVVRVVQHPDAFLEDVPPAAELQQLLARYRAQVASGRGSRSGAGGGGKKGTGKKVKKPTEQAAACAATVVAAYGAGEVKPNKKKKKKKKSKGRKQQQQQPVYLSQMDHLLHTVSDAGVLCELREAEAHEMRQAAARKHRAAVPTAPAAATSSGSAAAAAAAGGMASSRSGGGENSSRGGGVAGGCSRIERLLTSLSGERVGEGAAAKKAVACDGATAASANER
jgi:hypothetical protein